MPWTLSADEALALPLDELALSILRDAHSHKEWNYRNWLLKAQHHAYSDRVDAQLACAEAWGWLQANGLLRGRPRSVTAQVPEVRKCKIGITLFDCPRDNRIRPPPGNS